MSADTTVLLIFDINYNFKSMLTSGMTIRYAYNRSGTFAFKVKVGGIITVLSLSGPPYKSHNAKRAWFVLTSSCNGSIANHNTKTDQTTSLIGAYIT